MHSSYLCPSSTTARCCPLPMHRHRRRPAERTEPEPHLQTYPQMDCPAVASLRTLLSSSSSPLVRSTTPTRCWPPIALRSRQSVRCWQRRQTDRQYWRLAATQPAMTRMDLWLPRLRRHPGNRLSFAAGMERMRAICSNVCFWVGFRWAHSDTYPILIHGGFLFGERLGSDGIVDAVAVRIETSGRGRRAKR